ncbi:MAG TPA: hypothetical protein PKX38_10490, partial [Alphaproteobacteria bacterium]|nr:hypothetical protein [Alphaproteobacteria bacterium]
ELRSPFLQLEIFADLNDVQRHSNPVLLAGFSYDFHRIWPRFWTMGNDLGTARKISRIDSAVKRSFKHKNLSAIRPL